MSTWFNSNRQLLLQVIKQNERILSFMPTVLDAIQTAAQAAEASFAALKTQLTTIQTGVKALDDKIKALAAQLAAGGVSAIDQAALDALVADSAALVTQSQSIDTTVPQV